MMRVSDVERMVEIIKEQIDRNKDKPGTVHVWHSTFSSREQRDEANSMLCLDV